MCNDIGSSTDLVSRKMSRLIGKCNSDSKKKRILQNNEIAP